MRQPTSAVDGPRAAALPRDSHDQPGCYRRFLDRPPLVVARREPCGAMARLIDYQNDHRLPARQTAGFFISR
jgi:hypothetical protein